MKISITQKIFMFLAIAFFFGYGYFFTLNFDSNFDFIKVGSLLSINMVGIILIGNILIDKIKKKSKINKHNKDPSLKEDSKS